VPVSVPMGSPYVSQSPYSLRQGNGQPILLKERQEIFPVRFISRPRFYDYFTSDGLPCSKIALLHGSDCLATSVIQTCLYWHSEKRCRFCGIELSLENGQTIGRKTPDQLAEVARIAKSVDGVRHSVLTTGTDKPPGREILVLSECASAIKKATDLPVHAQCLPPSELARLCELREAGVDTVGIHIDTGRPGRRLLTFLVQTR
jgi:radical SAM protein (TIGR04043 family)